MSKDRMKKLGGVDDGVYGPEVLSGFGTVKELESRWRDRMGTRQ